MRRDVPTHLGSALRLSQPLSGSSQARVPRLCFAPQPFLVDHLPFEVFPSQGSRTSLEAASSPAVIHPPQLTSPSRPYHRRFPRRPRLAAQLPDSPDDYALPFDAPRRASRLRWTPSDRIARLRSFTRFEALLPLRVRSRRSELPRSSGRYSLGVRPLQRPPRTSDPRPRPTRRPSAQRHPEASPRDPEDRSPPSRERPDSVRKNAELDLSVGTRHPSAPAHAASRRRVLLPWPSAQPGEPDIP
jgi:hypothetical protein